MSITANYVHGFDRDTEMRYEPVLPTLIEELKWEKNWRANKRGQTKSSK